MTLLSSAFFSAYGALWRAAEPLLRRHKRLADGFEQRLAPASWPGLSTNSPAKQPPGPAPGLSPGSLPPAGPDTEPSSGFASGAPLPCPGPDTGSAPASAPAYGSRTRLWIQAASGGEARLVQALLPALRESLGPLSLLCTSCTRQGMDILQGLAVPADSELVPAFFPLDRPDLMEKALTQAAPKAVILLETELWPGLMRAVKKRGLPLLVLNGRMTPKSRRAYGLAGPLWAGLAPDRVLAISREDADRFASLFGPACAVSVMSNIKFDLAGAFARTASEQVAEQGSAPGPASGRTFGQPSGPEQKPVPAQAPSPRRQPPLEGASSDTRPEQKDFDAPLAVAHGQKTHWEAETLPGLLLLFASVREEEEKILLPVLTALHGQKFSGMPLSLVLAPRHLHRLKAWRSALANAGLPCAALSTTRGAAMPASEPPPILLQDRFGELQALYRAADAAFVGGSLAPLGGQNFLEALSQGLSPFVGPWVENFAWTGREIFTQKLVRQIPDAQSLLASLEEELANLAAQAASSADAHAAGNERRRRIRESFTRFLAPRLGGASRAAQAVALAIRPVTG